MKFQLEDDITAEMYTSVEGLWGAIKLVFGNTTETFKHLFVDMPTKYKYKLLGQVFCRPAPDYQMPRAPTIFNVDNTKCIPQWPTTKTHEKSTDASIDRGLSYGDVLKKWTKFADFVVGISKIDENSDAGSEIDKLFANIFTNGDFGAAGVSSGLKFQIVSNKWPTDKWFTDTGYSLVTELESLASKITNAAQTILSKRYKFDTPSEKIGTRTKVGLLKVLVTIYKKSNTKCYNFGGSLYNLKKKLELVKK